MQEKLLQNFPWPVPTRVCRVWIGKNWPFSLIRLREKPVCDTVTEHYLKRLYKFSLLPKSSSPKPAAASAPHRHRYYTRIESSYAYSHSWEPQKRGELTGLFWEHMFSIPRHPKMTQSVTSYSSWSLVFKWHHIYYNPDQNNRTITGHETKSAQKRPLTALVSKWPNSMAISLNRDVSASGDTMWSRWTKVKGKTFEKDTTLC